MPQIIEAQTTDGRSYWYRPGSPLKFSTREIAERHFAQADANKARFLAAVAADTPEQRAANMRAFFGLKAEG